MTKKVKFKKDSAEVIDISKGDVPGHEFHGNQYTDGSGGDSESKIQADSIGTEYKQGNSTFTKVTAKDFIAARNEMPAERVNGFINMYTEQEMIDSKSVMLLSKDNKTGVAIHDGDELINLFSRGPKGAGADAVRLAIDHGANRLDCVDIQPRGLKQFYESFGFKEERREKNWTEGEPDIIYMRRSI